MNLRDLPLGALVVRERLAEPEDVRDALVAAQELDRRLGEVLVERGILRDRELARLLAQQERLDVVDLDRVQLDDAAVDCLPEELARRHRLIPFRLAGNVLQIAIADPTDDAAIAAVRAATGRRIRFHVAAGGEVDAALVEAFGEPLAVGRDAAGPE